MAKRHGRLVRREKKLLPESQPHYVKVALVSSVVGGIVQVLVNHFDGFLLSINMLWIHFWPVLQRLIFGGSINEREAEENHLSVTLF